MRGGLVVKRILLLSLLLPTIALAAEKNPLKDPLRPLKSQNSAVSSVVKKPAESQLDWRLGAVLVAADRAVAMINGQALQVGDRLHGYQVKQIEPGSVLLTKGQKKLVLRRSGTGLKKASVLEAGEGSQP